MQAMSSETGKWRQTERLSQTVVWVTTVRWGMGEERKKMVVCLVVQRVTHDVLVTSMRSASKGSGRTWRAVKMWTIAWWGLAAWTVFLERSVVRVTWLKSAAISIDGKRV